MKKIVLALVLAMIFPTFSVAFADHPGKAMKKHRKEQQKAVRKQLPKDWRKRVAKGKHIDDDFSVFFVPVPKDVVRALPPLPPGVSYKRIENDIVKIHNANMEILEVLTRNLPTPPLPKVH